MCSLTTDTVAPHWCGPGRDNRLQAGADDLGRTPDPHADDDNDVEAKIERVRGEDRQTLFGPVQRMMRVKHNALHQCSRQQESAGATIGKRHGPPEALSGPSPALQAAESQRRSGRGPSDARRRLGRQRLQRRSQQLANERCCASNESGREVVDTPQEGTGASARTATPLADRGRLSTQYQSSACSGTSARRGEARARDQEGLS